MRKCFVDVGLAKGANDKYKKYVSQRRGTLAFKKADVKDDESSLGEVAAELEMVQREGVDSEDEGEGENEEEDEESEGEDED